MPRPTCSARERSRVVPSQATPGGGRGPRFDRAWVIAVAGSVLALLAAWRCTLGMTFVDDGYYAATTVRLAQGARIFVDEMFVQSLGFLAAIPFARIWLWIFGETVHGDYRHWANPETLDSVTNYECYKGLYSSLVDSNYFEIAYALERQFGRGGIYAVSYTHLTLPTKRIV